MIHAAQTDCEEFTYIIDSAYMIQAVDASFNQFAAKNGAPGLNGNSVIGQSLFKYISGEETEHLYKVLIDRVLIRRQAVRFPFRCDSPEERRFMELSLSPIDSDSVRFQNQLVRREKRVTMKLLDPSTSRSHRLVSMCSWCKKIRIDDQWIEIEDGIVRLQLLNRPDLPKITHGICQPCKSDMLLRAGRL